MGFYSVSGCLFVAYARREIFIRELVWSVVFTVRKDETLFPFTVSFDTGGHSLAVFIGEV